MDNHQKKVRILSFHHIPNSGAFLFAYSLLNIFKQGLQGFDVKLLNYKSKRLAAYEYAKRYKVFQKVPLFYFRRAQMWAEQIQSFLDVDADLPYFSGEKSLQQLFAKKYDALVVGMDVWCITQGSERPKFPNIYWLPEKTTFPRSPTEYLPTNPTPIWSSDRPKRSANISTGSTSSAQETVTPFK